MGKTRDLFKKITYQGIISCKDGLDKGQKWYVPNKQKILRGGKNTQNCTKKDLYVPDNHDGVITHLKPDILECVSQVGLRKHHYKQSQWR